MSKGWLITLGWVCACNSSPSGSLQKAPVAPPDHQIHRADTPEHGAIHTQILGGDVSLSELPFMTWIGLPASGRADISVDVRVPDDHGQRDFRGATGEISLRCMPCRVGDDKAMLDTGKPSAFGSQLDVGHLDFDRAETKIKLANGHAKIEQFTIASPDVSIELSADLQLAKTVEDSQIDGCLRFKELPALEARSPKTAAIVRLTGAPRGADGLFNIHLMGKLSEMRQLAQVCDGSAPPPAVVPPTPAKAPGCADTVDPVLTAAIAKGVVKKSETEYSVDHSLIAKITADPMCVSRGGRIVPAIKDGKPNGFKIYAIMPDSFPAKLGFHNGDTLETINGYALMSADKALDAYRAVSEAKIGQTIAVTIERAGAPLTLTYKLN